MTDRLIWGALIALFLLFCFLLARSVKKHLYAFSNVVLTGGVLYSFAMAVAFPFAFYGGGESFSAAAFFSVFPERFCVFGLWTVTLLCLAVAFSNAALIVREGFRPKNLMGILLALVYWGGAGAVALVSRVGTPLFPDGALSFLFHTVSLFFASLLCYLECCLIGFCLTGLAAARHRPPFDRDLILIPGCSIGKEGGLLPLLKARTNRAVRFAWEQEIATGKKVLYLPCGGQGEDEVMSEGSAMELYLLSHGAESDEVFPEKKSKNTFENFAFARQIVREKFPGAKIAFSTTDYHVLRSGMLAAAAGFEGAEGIASHTKWYFWPNGFVREFFAVMVTHKKVHFTVAGALLLLSVLARTAAGP